MELLIIAVIGIAVLAVGAPSFTAFRESQRARNAARVVERELQTARLKAVTVSRALRVRFNCPAAGQMRILEVTSVPATDNATNRCSPSAFPSPGPNDALRSTPANDSPVIYLPEGTTVSGGFTQFEFTPRGEVYSVSQTGDVTSLPGDVVMTIARGGWTHTVTINALGRIRLN